MKSNQRGRFSLSLRLLMDCPDLVAKAFQDMNFVAVKADINFSDNVDYSGLSDRFDEVEKGYLIPELVDRGLLYDQS